MDHDGVLVVSEIGAFIFRLKETYHLAEFEAGEMHREHILLLSINLSKVAI